MPIVEEAKEHIIQLTSKNNAKVFIETGTHIGDGVAWALQHFDMVYSCEAARSFAQISKNRFDTDKRVKIYEEESVDFLTRVMWEFESTPTVIFLDAHYSGGPTYKLKTECPVLAELEIVLTNPLATILVDDVWLFTQVIPSGLNQADWPRLNEITDLIKRHRPNVVPFEVGSILFVDVEPGK